MKVTVKYGLLVKDFDNQTKITIGNNENCDVIIKDIKNDKPLALVFVPKYNNYVIVNPYEDNNITLNKKTFTKTFVENEFSVEYKELNIPVRIMISNETKQKEIKYDNFGDDSLTLDEIEQKRTQITEEMRFKVYELKKSVSNMNIIMLVLNISMLILSVVCSFAVTNFLLGLKINNSTSVLNLTTNVGFLFCTTLVVFAMALTFQQGYLLYLDEEKKQKTAQLPHKIMLYVPAVFLFVIYILNLFYYKDIPGFAVAALFVSLLFTTGLGAVAVAGGYTKNHLKAQTHELMKSEYRQDFENIIKNYCKYISQYVNRLSQNKINNIKEELLNSQFRMIVEVIAGILTAPFLAYGVSNTLASCFPEAASWIRISGIRFSPIFLVLATFLIIFAFFSFVRAFAIGKQIKCSEIIKYDGFRDYKYHGVTILGIDAVNSLNKEKNVTMTIACSIILIEFTMNVSYFIGEIGSDFQGLFLSIVTALVPTALLIAETQLLSSTTNKINNFKELLSALD